LEVAKKLLTSDGCLIVAIDKNEQAELTVLLKELFRGYEIYVITIVHNPRGAQGTNFSYTHEYAIFAVPQESLRTDAKNCFYPIIIENEKVIGFGEVVADDYHPEKQTIEKDEEIKKLLRVKKTKSGYEIELGKDFGTYKTNAIILDFFAGSGTTAHAVLELNKQDGGNRKFVLCEQMDYIETVTKERIRKVCEIDNQERMKKIAFLSYKIEPKDIDNSKQEFTELSFTDQKKFLISLLDKNLLYVPYCDMEDRSYGITEEVKKLNYRLYGE
ncbi:12207_t:CDS:2, partial [Racocetra persica]